MELTQKQKETLRRNNEESNRVTRESIGGALYILMKTQDFNKIKISDIIQRSGVSRSAFYPNYKTKEKILYWVKSGMHGTDKDAAEMILKSYCEIIEDIQTYS